MGKKAQARKIKNITPTFEGLGEDLKDVFDNVEQKSDRDVALLVASYLDDSLNAMYRKLLQDEGKPDGEFIKSIMGNRGPLSSFSARIDMAYALGWIGPRVRDSLNVIRNIRNDFAHHYKIDRFDHPDIWPQCENLKLQWELFPGKDISHRHSYLFTFLFIAVRINNIALLRSRPPEGTDAKPQHVLA